jgi:hypothetical protein
MKKLSQEDTPRKNPLGYILALILGIGFIAYGLSDSPGLKLGLGVAITWESVVLHALPAFIAATLLPYIGYLFARLTQWRFIAWLDARLLPAIKSRKRKVEKVPEPVWWRGNPDLPIAPEGATIAEEGKFMTDIGEKIVDGIYFPSWEVRTNWPCFWERLVVTIITGALSTVILTINASVLTVAACLIIIAIPSFYFGVLKYWSREWERHAEFFFTTTHRYILTKSEFSWLGFLFKKGFDIEVRYTPIGNVTDVDQAGVPRTFGIKVGLILESLIESWSKGPSKVGTVAIRSRVLSGAEFLINYNFAPAIRAALQKAKSQNLIITDDILQTRRETESHKRGRPGESRPAANRDQEAADWMVAQFEKKGYAPPYEFDVFEFRASQLSRLGYKDESVESSVPPTVDDTDQTSTVTVANHFQDASPKPAFEEVWSRISPNGKERLARAGFTELELRQLYDHTSLDVQTALDLIREGSTKQQILEGL